MDTLPPTLNLKLQPLTAEAFAPFGDVIQAEEKTAEIINYGHTSKWSDLARIDTGDSGGRTAVHLFEGAATHLPLRIEVLECHPLGSQAFVPLHREPFLVVVARAGAAPKSSEVTAFITNGHQGVNYHKGTWHHYLVSPLDGGQFLIIDRVGPGLNLQEHTLDTALVIQSGN